MCLYKHCSGLKPNFDVAPEPEDESQKHNFFRVYSNESLDKRIQWLKSVKPSLWQKQIYM